MTRFSGARGIEREVDLPDTLLVGPDLAERPPAEDFHAARDDHARDVGRGPRRGEGERRDREDNQGCGGYAG